MSVKKPCLPIGWEHDEWVDFWEALIEALYGEMPDRLDAPSKCRGNHAHTRRILREMGCFAVNATIEQFKELGGYCDCEVAWNAVKDS